MSEKLVCVGGVARGKMIETQSSFSVVRVTGWAKRPAVVPKGEPEMVAMNVGTYERQKVYVAQGAYIEFLRSTDLTLQQAMAELLGTYTAASEFMARHPGAMKR